MLRSANDGRALSALSATSLCAVVVKDLPQLCSSSPTRSLLSDRALDSLIRLSSVSQLTEHDVRLLFCYQSLSVCLIDPEVFVLYLC